MKNFAAGRTGAWREVWPLIADYEDAFLRALIDLDPDLVHVHDRHPLPAAAAYGRYLAARGRPAVPWVYDAHEWLPGQMMPGPVDQRIAWKAAEAELIHQADAVVTVTDELADRMRDYHALMQRPVTVINGPWGTRVPMDPAERRPLRTELGLPEDVPLLVYVGKLAEVRGVGTLVDGLPLLPGVHVAFVGSPDPGARQALRDRASELGVADRLHIVDYVPSASVTWYVSSATVGVSPLLPTPAHESAVATKLRECLLAGLPLVVSDLREQARFVREQGVGTVFTPGDAADFARAVRDLLRRRAVFDAAARAPEIEARHGWEASEQALHVLWRRLVPAAAVPGPVGIAPEPAREPRPRGLLVVGDAPSVRPLLDTWPAAAGPATQRAPRDAPEGRGLAAGGPEAAWALLWDWVEDDRVHGTILSGGEGPLWGRAEQSPVHELLSLQARGRRVALVAGERALAGVGRRLMALPGHPWGGLDPETRAALDRRIRRQGRPFQAALAAGLPVLTHRRVDALLTPGLLWLPAPIPTSPDRGPEREGASAPRSVLVLPGDRTPTESAAVDELVAELAARRIPVEAPSGPLFRRRPGAFRGDVVVAPLHTGELEIAALQALAAGSAVVAGRPASLAPGEPAPPVAEADDSMLLAAVLGLLDETTSAARERRERAREHHARLHAPEAVLARLEDLLAPSPTTDGPAAV